MPDAVITPSQKQREHEVQSDNWGLGDTLGLRILGHFGTQYLETFWNTYQVSTQYNSLKIFYIVVLAPLQGTVTFCAILSPAQSIVKQESCFLGLGTTASQIRLKPVENGLNFH